MIRAWIEAMRLRTLPVSVAGVFAAAGYCSLADDVKWWPLALCLVFAVLAQIASNFANEYYDFKGGLDKKGREGPRRGVTEGDITPNAMKYATYGTLAAACAVGLSLVIWGGWWLIPIGILIALGVLAYSTGPYPLSHHALGEVAVVFFFGIIPVCLTVYVVTGGFTVNTFLGSVAIGLMGANVLLVNNYRDCDDDKAVGKTTLAVKFGRGRAAGLYLVNGYVAVALMYQLWVCFSLWWLIAPAAYLFVHTSLWLTMGRKKGAQLTPILGITATLMLAYSLAFAFAAFTR